MWHYAWSLPARPLPQLTSAFTHGFSCFYPVSVGFRTRLRDHHLQEVFLESAPCQDPPKVPFMTLSN